MGFALRAIAAEVEKQRERFLLGAENALRARPKEDEALREEDLNRLKRKVGELPSTWIFCARRTGCALRRRGRRTSNCDIIPVSIRRMCRVLKFPRAPLRARYILRLRYHHDWTRCWRNGSKDRSKDIRPLLIAGLGIAALR
jgi:hypothetical protein